MGPKASKCSEQEAPRSVSSAVDLDSAVRMALEKQRAFFATGATKQVGWRREMIKKLASSVIEA
eukprot:CAMPEP_0117506752 /NCGR_PEP_ID=MMETSP0784-20121206/26071_1 /TAXON_ID=39447 /ORGANISM="" /LENGTH=63 /DNA_ID=CAMNT_0005302237 /DNA_START=23 /DNA_END=210 /DNA_ORIENTATION=-